MTTPGGVPNLPKGALTLDTLSSNLEDMSGTAMHSRAADRMPDIFQSSTGGNILFELSPFGIITSIWAEFNSLVANADPADIQGPEDLPGLLVDFIEGLPVVGQFIEVLNAILGNYVGDDETLLAIQEIFAPIRKMLQLVTGIVTGFPTVAQVASSDLLTKFGDVLAALEGIDITNPGSVLAAIQGAVGVLLSAIITALGGTGSDLPALAVAFADKFTSTLSEAADTASALADAVYNILIDLITQFAEGLLGALGGFPIIGTLITTTLTWLFDTSADLLGLSNDAWTDAQTAITTLPISGDYATVTALTPGDQTQAQITDTDMRMKYDAGTGQWVTIQASTGSQTDRWAPPPNDASWIDVGLSAGVADATFDKDSMVIHNYGLAVDAIRGRYRIAGGPDYDLEVYGEYDLIAAYQQMCFVMMRSSTGKFATFGVGFVASVTSVFVHYWNSATSFNSIAYAKALTELPNGMPRHLALRRTGGGNFRYEFAYNGEDWRPFRSEPSSGHFLPDVSYLGVGTYDTIVAEDVKYRLRKWDLI